MIATWRSTGSGSYCPCFKSSTIRSPRVSWSWVALSKSDPNWKNAASSRNCARSRRSRPATFFMAFVCALPPTRETEIPTLIAGRMPAKKRSLSRKIWPSVMEITFVGMYAAPPPAAVLQHLHHLRDREVLLAHRDVDAVEVARGVVEDRVDRERGLAGLAVADDKLALPAPDRDHRIDGLEAGLHRLIHRLAVHDARRVTLQGSRLVRDDRTFAVDRLPDRVHDPADHRLADRDGSDLSGAAHGVSLLDVVRAAE